MVHRHGCGKGLDGLSMTKAIKIFNALFLMATVAVLVWVAWSFADVVAHNLTRYPEYSEANLFTIVTSCK